MKKIKSSASKTGKQLSFSSRLVNWAKGMDYCAIPVPAAITKSLGTKAAVLVMARVNNSEPFKVSLFPAGEGRHFIRVRSKVRKDANLNEGDTVKVKFKVLDRADILIPKDLEVVLKADDLSIHFDNMTAGKKNYIIRRIDDASKPETRAKRIIEAVEEARQESKKKAKRTKV